MRVRASAYGAHNRTAALLDRETEPDLTWQWTLAVVVWVWSRRSHPSSPVSAAAGRIFGPEKAKKHTKNTHKIKIKSKLNQNQLWDTVAHVGALHLSQATALRPVDAVVVPNASKRKENEIKPLVSTSKPLSTVQSHHFRKRYSPTTSECIAARAWRSAASLTAHVVMMRRL